VSRWHANEKARDAPCLKSAPHRRANASDMTGGHVRRLLLAIAVAALPACHAAAQQSGRQVKTPKAAPRHPAKVNSCAMYGPGFVKVEGSNTCIKIGGGVSVEAGGSMRR
jgi:hypothetical protein